eukprot:COSAG02_NODE_6865_length_3317_cov_148.665631_1_plen_142_part_00
MAGQDYYAALLFNRLMGTTVLSVSVSQTPQPDPSSPIRAYAHCCRNSSVVGAVTVLLINLGGHTNVTLMDHLETNLLLSANTSGVDIYRLAPPKDGGRTSHEVQVSATKCHCADWHSSIYLLVRTTPMRRSFQSFDDLCLA